MPASPPLTINALPLFGVPTRRASKKHPPKLGTNMEIVAECGSRCDAAIALLELSFVCLMFI
jgi:hypothetical protein